MTENEDIDILNGVTDNNYPVQDNLDIAAALCSPQNTTEFFYHDYSDLLFERTTNFDDSWYDVNLSRNPLQPLLENSTTETNSKQQQNMNNEPNDDWTENEKNLLKKAIEIFGTDSSSEERLAQFIGSKTSTAVKSYMEKHSNENQVFCEYLPIDTSSVIEIPVNIENVIGEISVEQSCISSDNVDENENKAIQTENVNSRIKHRKRFENNLSKEYAKFKRINPDITEISSRTSIEAQIKTETDDDIKPTRNRIKIEEEDDLYIDIEGIDDEPPENSETPEQGPSTIMPKTSTTELIKKPMIDLTKYSEIIVNQLTSMAIPTSEVLMNNNVIEDLEKVFHEDFFKGRLTKTPERYLKIRNHILHAWNVSKPNYANKTSMRVGLKNCGDVTCISRIHYFLEQIGAINFGCEQTKYERPLLKVLEQQIQANSNNKSKTCKQQLMVKEPVVLSARQRIKKRLVQNDGLGGYTLAHDERGQIINTTIVHEEPKQPYQRDTDKDRLNRNLINCMRFKNEHRQSFSVQINLSALLLMDFHAHSCRTEIMGMLGGLWDSINKNVMIICYVPCKNIASSSTHCDMCPVSQIKSAEIIHSQYLQILGWFHSHPTFAPEPSQQDLYTQNSVQQWIGYDQPCIGIILTPFNYSPHHSSTSSTILTSITASPFRCMIVDKQWTADGEEFIPYRLDVDVTCDNYIIADFLNEMKSILYMHDDAGSKNKKIKFMDPYFKDHSITHLDKFLLSVEAHMAKYDTLNKATDTIEAIKSFILRENR